ncbi:BrxA family protein [Exiguobacterium undae]|uniref:BrxA family protein n=1 Tax=Exiguobacterium undae TaxID=169177 RepID=UPI00054E6992|nr:BrxA family protein [Exiguobacterium undae]
MKYSSSFTSEGWFKKEIEYILNELHKGHSREEIRNKIIEDNIFMLKSEFTIRKRFQTVFRRADTIYPNLYKYYINGTNSDQKALLLYSFLKCYLYAYENFFEFITYKYQDKNGILRISDMNFYMEEKEQQSKQIANWNIATRKKINSTLLLFYRESGMIELEKDIYIISPLYVSHTLKKYAEDQDVLLKTLITLNVGN